MVVLASARGHRSWEDLVAIPGSHGAAVSEAESFRVVVRCIMGNL